MEEAFGRFLKRAAEVGLVSPDEVQVLDSTAIWGRGAVEDTYNLIGSAVRKLLGATARGRGRKPEVLAKEIGLVLTAPAEGGSLKGRAGIEWSAPEERRSFLNGVVQEARLLLEETEGDGDVSAEVAEAAELLRCILVQDLQCVGGSETSEKRDGPEDGDEAQSVLSLVLCSQSLFRFADLGDDGLCRGGPDKGCGVIVSAIDVVVDRLD